MAASKPKPARKLAAADTVAAVDAFMSSLEHPHKPAIEVLRRVICGASASIAEGIKWNAPSFRTTEYFASTHLRAKEGFGVILHLGAKARSTPSLKIEDPEGLLTWLGKDRAMVTFSGLSDLKSRKAAFQAIVRQWIEHV